MGGKFINLRELLGLNSSVNVRKLLFFYFF